MSTESVRKRFTVDEYMRMVEVGILHERDRVELIDGEVVEMSPIGAPHSGCLGKWTMLFVPRLVGRAIVWIQTNIRLGRYSQPEPDMVILRPRGDYYKGSLPSSADVLLLVEVAETSLKYDRSVKRALYASAGIAEYWIVDVAGRSIEVYRSPGPSGYAVCERRAPGERIAPQAFPDVEHEVSQLLD